ncbi:MAG: right-handed parallel beta-helix repeat-containing protein [Patescibacteria group bacterium]
MRWRNFFLLTLAFTVLALLSPAWAETVVDLDVLTDTVWTQEMSPILIKGNTRNDRIRRVANGARLTIEPGVTIKVSPGLSFQVSSQCLRGYGSEVCYRDQAGEVKLSRLIARGTKANPIIFTSDRKSPQAGDWGSVIIEARDSELSWVEFRYGGMRSMRAFVEVENSVFENNLIEYGGPTAALFTGNQIISNSVIRGNAGVGIFCNHQCEIKESFIARNAGAAVELDTVLETKITDNFIYQNGGYGVKNENILPVPIIVTDNFFVENAGGIYSHRSHDQLSFHRNNFLGNTEFAIKSDINNRVELTYEAQDNWFGIDTGSRTDPGPYFVSADYDVSEFATDGHDFMLPTGGLAQEVYRQHLGQSGGEDAFFQASIQRKTIFGNESIPGSILRYAVTLSNRTTKAVGGVTLKVSSPGDQIILLCSALPATADFGYSLATACATGLPSAVSFSRDQLVWQPGSIGAIQEQTLFFVTAIKPTAKTAGLPRILFSPAEGEKSRPFVYQLGATVELKRSGDSNVSKSAPAPLSQPSSSPAPVPTLTSGEPSELNGALAVGTVTRGFVSGTLHYILSATDGNKYLLFNKDKWREIDDFSKGADKDKQIAVFGDYYLNRFGVKTGIKFTRFEVR